MPKLVSSLMLAAALVAPTAQAIAQETEAAASAQAGAEEPQPTNEWLTWGYDQRRTGWNRSETILGKDNVSQLGVQWQVKLDTEISDVALSTLTAPVVAEGISTAQGTKTMLYVVGADSSVFALDASSGQIVWRKNFEDAYPERRDATWLCPSTVNATPVIDKKRNLLFLISADGKLQALNLGDGSPMMAPTQMVAPFARAWSLNLIGDIVYTTSGRSCGQLGEESPEMLAALHPMLRNRAMEMDIPAIDPSAVAAADISDLDNPKISYFFTSDSRQATPWGRGGAARGPDDTVLVETSNGVYDPAGGNFSSSILRIAPRAARLVDSFTPENHKHIQANDLGGSASPIVFPYDGKSLVAVSNKEAVLYVLDADDMGGGPDEQHFKPLLKGPQIGNDAAEGTDPSQGVWGSLSTYETPDGDRFIYAPVWGPPSVQLPGFRRNNGPIEDGSIMAFRLTGTGENLELVPEWSSPNMIMPDPPVIANGVVYAIQTGGQPLQNPTNPDGTRYDARTTQATYRATPVSNLVLYAMDAETGDVLYSSGDTIADWVHFSEPVVAQGKVFLVTHDAHVYAFGVDN